MNSERTQSTAIKRFACRLKRYKFNSHFIITANTLGLWQMFIYNVYVCVCAEAYAFVMVCELYWVEIQKLWVWCCMCVFTWERKGRWAASLWPSWWWEAGRCGPRRAKRHPHLQPLTSSLALPRLRHHRHWTSDGLNTQAQSDTHRNKPACGGRDVNKHRGKKWDSVEKPDSAFAWRWNLP